MIVIGNTYISDDIADKFFVCDLDKCKGACCIEGHLGAPLEEEELGILKEVFEKVKPYLSPEGLEVIKKEGLFVKDYEDDYSTPTIGDRECVYAVYDEKGVLQCGIERAYLDGKINFPKPMSCHLYPIRITKYTDFDALNYHEWDICKAACQLGSKLGIPIYKFLKEALIRKYGEDWYNTLEKKIADRG